MSHEAFRFGKKRDDIFSGLYFGAIEHKVMFKDEIFVDIFILRKCEFFSESGGEILFGVKVEFLLIVHF